MTATKEEQNHGRSAFENRRIKSPNPFWLASAPPTNMEYNVVRAFDAGWGGVVWKTLGDDPPIVNVSSRYGGHRRQARNG